MDLKISRGYRDQIWFDIHSKPSTIAAPILFNSAHPMSAKLSFFRSFINRAITHTTFSFSELRHLNNISNLAIKAGFKHKSIINIISQKRLHSNMHNRFVPSNLHPQQVVTPLKFLPSIPFSPEFIKIASFIKKKCHFNLPFSTPKTISNFVVSDRQSASKGGGGVYKIPVTSPSGDLTYYIGQTCRSIATRSKEHASSTNNVYCNTAIKSYLKNNPTAIPHWDKIEVIASPPTQAQLLCRETIEINLTHSVINAKEGKFLNQLWMPYLKNP